MLEREINIQRGEILVQIAACQPNHTSARYESSQATRGRPVAKRLCLCGTSPVPVPPFLIAILAESPRERDHLLSVPNAANESRA